MEMVIPAPGPVSVGAKLTQRLVQMFVDSCNEFLEWQYRELIESRPSPAKLSEHRDSLKAMLRLAHTIHGQVTDPDFPARQFIPEVTGKLRQLEESWEMIQNPMNDAEADAILQKAFPDEPRAGSAA